MLSLPHAILGLNRDWSQCNCTVIIISNCAVSLFGIQVRGSQKVMGLRIKIVSNNMYSNRARLYCDPY